MAKGKYARKRLLKELRRCSIHNSGLSARTIKALEATGIENMADLTVRTEEDLKAIPGIGDKAMEEIRAVQEQK